MITHRDTRTPGVTCGTWRWLQNGDVCREIWAVVTRVTISFLLPSHWDELEISLRMYSDTYCCHLGRSWRFLRCHRHSVGSHLSASASIFCLRCLFFSCCLNSCCVPSHTLLSFPYSRGSASPLRMVGTVPWAFDALRAHENVSIVISFKTRRKKKKKTVIMTIC